MKLLRVLLVLTVSCSPRIAQRSTQPNVVSVSAAANQGPVWQLWPEQPLPFPLRDVGALTNQGVIAIANDELYYWNNGRQPSPCPRAPYPLQFVRTLGTRYLALAGDRRRAAVLTGDAAEDGSCRLVLLSTDYVFSNPGIEFQPNVAFLKTGSDTILQSTDFGIRWTPITPLHGVVHLAPLSNQRVLAAVEDRPDTPGSSVHLYLLSHPRGTWTQLHQPGGVTTPVEFGLFENNQLWFAHRHGLLQFDGEGNVLRRTDEAAFYHGFDYPGVTVPAGAGRFLSSTNSRVLVFRSDSEFRYIDRMPAHTMFALDSAPDGTVWFTTSARLFRALPNQTLEPVTDAPFDRGEPRHLFVAGANMAIITSERVLSYSTNRGRRWNAVEAPASIGELWGVAVTASHQLLVLSMLAGSLKLHVTSGDQFINVPLPEMLRTSRRPRIYTLGDRWILMDGAVWTTDDQGNQWRMRLGPNGEQPTSALLSTAVHGDSIIAIDQGFGLWRSDDSASTFYRLDSAGNLATLLREQSNPSPVLALDGRAHVLVVGRTSLFRSRDGGEHWSTINRRMLYTVVDATIDESGAVLLQTGNCGDRSLIAAFPDQLANTIASPTTPSRACAHTGNTWATDRGTVYLLSNSGTFSEAQSSRILRDSLDPLSSE